VIFLSVYESPNELCEDSEISMLKRTASSPSFLTLPETGFDLIALKALLICFS
jgi:hypothetical protein